MSSEPYYEKALWKRIEGYDCCLRLQWNPQIDRWEIWRQSRGRLHLVLRLQYPDGTYRGLDDRVLELLQSSDLWRHKNPTIVSNMLDEGVRKRWEKEDRDLEERLTYEGKEGWKHLNRSIVNVH